MPRSSTRENKMLGVTALYTSQAWIRGGLPEAELFDSPPARRIFNGVTTVYRVARRLRPGMQPLLPALLHRHLMIDHLLRQEGVRQVLELAAGLSPRGADFSANPQMTYTELDLPGVVAEKKRLLDQSERGRRVAARPNYRLLVGDVTTASLETVLVPDARAVVIAEGLHMYLDVATQRDLWARVAQVLRHGQGGVMLFDHFRRSASERPGLISRAVLWASKAWERRIGFLPDERTDDEIALDLERAGFDHARVVRAQDVAKAWSLPHADTATEVPIFVARVG